VVYNTQNYWGFGLLPSSGILENKQHGVSELDVFPSSGEGGPLERANLNHWTTPVRFTQLFNHLRPG
jgi:hypothetical protein